MTLSVSWRGLCLAGAMLAIASAPSLRAAEVGAGRTAPMQIAQSNDMPPTDIPGGPMGGEGGDAGALVVRIDRLENQLRAANGAIEELQNQQHRLEEQFKKFQEDVEFRLNGGKGAAPVAQTATPLRPAKRDDAFDPNADPNAAGAPRPLGSTPPSAPLDLSHNNVAPRPLPPAGPGAPAGPLANSEGPAVIPAIDAPPDDPRMQLNTAEDLLRTGQYDLAEQQLRAFLAKNGNNRFAAEAIFNLGETYLRRSRPREAAEQYLKLSTDYSKSPRAPEGMLRLGQSLAALGNNDQACATLGEIGRRYPTASSLVKKGVETEMQKDHC